MDSEDQIPKGREEEFITKRQDFLLRADAVNANAGVVLQYFIDRVETFVEKIGKPILGIEDHILRYEFQDRGDDC